ncbi:MAG: primosomal protein N' [Planctomycetota bacterium]
MARRSRDRGDAAQGPGLFGPETFEPVAPPAAPAPPPAGPSIAPPRRSPRLTAPAAPRAVVEPALYVDVAINRPMRREYTYAVEARHAERIAPGVRVAIPFAGKREVAVVVRTATECDVPPNKLKAVLEVLDPEPIVDESLLSLTAWIAREYACAWGEALSAALPAALKREGARRTVAFVELVPGTGAEALAEVEPRPEQHRLLRTLMEASGPLPRVDLLRRLNLSQSPLTTLVKRGFARVLHLRAETDALLSGSGTTRVRPEALTGDQAHALARMVGHLDARRFAPTLLFGVTGSGKTEVYLRVIEEALARGRGAIVLVPEISLTPQTVGWFRSRFGDVAVLHSQMTDAQRHDMWLRVKRKEARVVVGARSAIFAPVEDLGVVVVDEEHEPSFKQGSTPRYHARDVALERARAANAVCILGSATPALESWAAAERGELELLRLGARPGGARMPTVEVVDTRRERGEGGRPHLISRRLSSLLIDAVNANEQAILFINRRGFAPVLWCGQCGEVVTCEDCDVSLTWHKRLKRMVCHSCCKESDPPKTCAACTAPALRFLGAGSQRVEEVLAAVVPHARIGRMDSDTMLRREDYEAMLDAFGRGELDLLVGTQMIAKGLDFPRVTVVGIVAADQSLHQPDFRAAERTFQLVSQVAGRAGRGALEGRIVIQTTLPEDPSIVYAARHAYEAFAKGELESRRTTGFPPFGRLLRVVLEDPDEQKVCAAAASLAEQVRVQIEPLGARVLGPAPAPIAQVRGRHRQHVLVRTERVTRDGAPHPAFIAARDLLADYAGSSGKLRVSVDVDPVAML